MLPRRHIPKVMRVLEVLLFSAALAILLLVYLVYAMVRENSVSLNRALERQSALEERVEEFTDGRAPHIRGSFEVGGVHYLVEIPLRDAEPYDEWALRLRRALESAQRRFR